MSNTLLNALKANTNFTYTENGAVSRASTLNNLLDLYALGGAYRTRSEADCIVLFQKAYSENPEYALKCLFYLRNREGVGERRFFRVVYRWLAVTYPDIALRNMQFVPKLGRWDDLYELVNTPLEDDMFAFMKSQLALDVTSEAPSLLAKWLKSENTSSKVSRKLGSRTRKAFGFTAKQYRKTLSILRSRINIVEKLMTEGRWDEIKYEGLPSKAGFQYRNAFARHDHERYDAFMKSKTTKVNAGTLLPYEVVHKAADISQTTSLYDTARLAINKYWDCMTDFFQGATFNALCVADTSGSMIGSPMEMAVSLALYCAERAEGPFKNHYISFASRPQLIETAGVDFVDKVHRIYRTNLCDNTNIEATFDLVLRTIQECHLSPENLPEHIIVISDMEFDQARSTGGYMWRNGLVPQETLMEGIRHKWEVAGIPMPKLVYWNVNARHNLIPENYNSDISFVSGSSPIVFKALMSGKTGYDLMMEALSDPIYAEIR